MRRQLAIEWGIFVGAIAALMVYGAAPWWVVAGWLAAQTPIVLLWQVVWWQRRAPEPRRPVIVVYQPPIAFDASSVRLLEG
jgi:hypothetical protein